MSSTTLFSKMQPATDLLMDEERIMTPFFDHESQVVGWRCSQCSWHAIKPANLKRENFRALFASFDQHDCRALNSVSEAS